MSAHIQLGAIAHLPAEHQTEVCRMLPQLTRLGVDCQHKGVSFADDFDNPTWTLRLYRYGRRFHWVLALKQGEGWVHYTDIDYPNMRVEGYLREGLFFLSPLPALRKAEILGIQSRGGPRIRAHRDAEAGIRSLLDGADRLASRFTLPHLSPRSA